MGCGDLTAGPSLQAHASAGWLLHTGVKLGVTTPVGLRLRDTAAESGSLEGLTILGSGLGAGTGLGPSSLGWQYWAWALVVGRLDCSSLGEEPCVTFVWSLQKLPGAICEERNSNRSF